MDIAACGPVVCVVMAVAAFWRGCARFACARKKRVFRGVYSCFCDVDTIGAVMG